MTETAHDPQFPHLAPATAGSSGRAPVQPVVLVSLIALAALGWLYLALLAAATGQDALFAVCRPTFGRESTLWQAALALPMWCAMVLAMMLPTAGPMVVTYAQIADAAARKGERIVSPLVLAGGYLAVWFGFALLATILQALLARAALLDPAMGLVSPLFAGAILLGAGVYQFSSLKLACLTRCQHPFPFFFANWSDRAGGVFRLGLRQGLDCLGCCWALMLVMFAVGLMNVVWMAGLGLVMGLEKIAITTRLSRIVGLVLIAGGAAFVVSTVVTHWPVR